MRKKENKDRNHFIIYAVIVTALCLVFLFFKKDNILQWAKTGSTIRKQQATIRQLVEDNSNLDRRIEDLKSNRDSLEKFARETYAFCADSEDVYLVR